jgi:hypothetical protein
MQESAIAIDEYTDARTSDLILIKYAFCFLVRSESLLTPKRPHLDLQLLRVPHLEPQRRRLWTTKWGSVVDQLMLLSSC